MKVLITGANGFLGNYMTGMLLAEGANVTATGKGYCRLPFANNPNFTYTEMDFTDAVLTADVIADCRPDIIIHAGAMCRPDECELQKELAMQVNVTGTGNMLDAAAIYNSRFVYVSTDFVFDGKKGPYSEADTPNPVNFYGQTKLAAEQLVQQYKGEWAIIRTVLVYGKPLTGRSNILTVVKDKLESGELYKVVSDQLRTPTYVEDLAKGIAAVIQKNKTGIWHISGEDELTPYAMACAVAGYLQPDKILLQEVTAASFTQPASRPADTRFNIQKAKNELGYQPLSFAEGLIKAFS